MLELNGSRINPTMFPDKTSQVWKLDQLDPDYNEVWWWFENEAEVFQLAQLNSLLHLHGSRQSLYIPYLPYARQDKSVGNNSTFALLTLNQMPMWDIWDRVVVLDAHSNVGKFYLYDTNVDPVYPNNPYDTIIFPDAGAYNRYASLVNPSIRTIVGHKVRDSETGWIIDYSLDGKVNYDSYILVVDDICDGGATFNILADTLSKHHVTTDLYVTHGIFSKGVNQLLENYAAIYTTDSLFRNVDTKQAAKQCPNWKSIHNAIESGRLVVSDAESLMREYVKCTT